MQPDSLKVVDTVIQQLKNATVTNDSLNIAIQVAKEKAQEDRQLALAVATGISLALVTQFIINAVAWYRAQLTLASKRELVKSDLISKKDVISRLIEEYALLLNKFQTHDLDSHMYNSFNDFHTEIYESITKHELFKMYGDGIHDIIEIYNSMKFLKTRDVGIIYRNYLQQIDKHTAEHTENGHEDFCSTHVGFIRYATLNIEKHDLVAKQLLVEIDKFLKTTEPKWYSIQ